MSVHSGVEAFGWAFDLPFVLQGRKQAMLLQCMILAKDTEENSNLNLANLSFLKTKGSIALSFTISEAQNFQINTEASF